MGFWEIFALVLTGSGTLSSILGIFFAIYAKQNGRVTREFIAEQNRSMTEFLEKILERIDEGFKRMDEGFRRMDERAEQRHQEVIRLIRSMDERTALISRQIYEIPHKTVSLMK